MIRLVHAPLLLGLLTFGAAASDPVDDDPTPEAKLLKKAVGRTME